MIEEDYTPEPADVDRLLHDRSFRAIIKRVRDDQISLFVQSHPSQSDVREEAHQMIRALDKLEQAMRSVVVDEAIKMKRKGR